MFEVGSKGSEVSSDGVVVVDLENGNLSGQLADPGSANDQAIVFSHRSTRGQW